MSFETAKYISDTHYLNDYNEISNLNNNLRDANTAEKEKLNTINEQLKSKLLNMKQNYMLTDYAIHSINMYTNIIAFTILTICLVLVFVVKATAETKKMLIIICSIIGVFYMIIVIIILKSNSSRRNYSWNQWYWSPMKSKQ